MGQDSIFSYFWIFKGLDIACDYFFPKQSGFECLIFIWVLFPSVFIVQWFGDLSKIVITNWRDSILYDFLGYITATLIYSLQGFLIGVLISFIIKKLMKKK